MMILKVDGQARGFHTGIAAESPKHRRHNNSHGVISHRSPIWISTWRGQARSNGPLVASARCPGVVISSCAQQRDQWKASDYDKNARFVSEYGETVVNLLNPRHGERVLDLGCGDGALTVSLQDRGCDVIGVDSSPGTVARYSHLLPVGRWVDMVQAAIRRGVQAQVMDGHSIEMQDRSFDAVFSNAALHWMKSDPDAVICSVGRVLKPGGRFVGEMGGHGNVASITVALSAALEAHGRDPTPRHPWFFPSTTEYTQRLEEGGFIVKGAEIIPRPTVLPTGIQGWLRTFSAPWLEGIPKREQQEILACCEKLLRPVLCERDGTWTADYVRLRFHATLETPQKA